MAKLKILNPHDQSLVGELDISTPTDIKRAVDNARRAFGGWRNTSIDERIGYIRKYRDKISENKEEIARLATLEMGKPIKQSREDVDFELGFIDYYIENGAKNLADETVFSEGNENYRVVFEPYGVAAVIAPWNFPLSMANSGVLPALIVGNTVVFKPSEYTSMSQKQAIELLWEAGIPEGVVNFIIGDGEVGRALIDSQIDFVWFTGSTKTGQEIYKKCGEKFIKAVCELGGSSAGIVFADAKLEVTLENIFWSRFLNCGQVCSAVKRLFVEKSVYDDILQKYISRLKKARMGSPMEEGVDIGPLVSKKQLEKLEEQVKDALAKGAKVEVGGRRPEGKEFARGNYYEPTILTGVNFDMKVMNEEVFGPVLPVMSFETEAEVIEMANRTPYGLTTEVYTSDMLRGERLARAIESGVVAVNTTSYYRPVCPIGGYKKSGIGREYGKIGMQEFAQVKLIAVAR